MEIQKFLDGEGAHPPPQTPPPARRCAPRRSSFGRSFTGPPQTQDQVSAYGRGTNDPFIDIEQRQTIRHCEQKNH